MRIAFWVRAGNKYGSVERYIALFAQHCRNRGHSFLLLNEIENTSPEYTRRLKAASSEQIVIGETAVNPLKVFSRVCNVINSWRPDVVQVHLATTSSVPFLRLKGVPCIYPTYNNGIVFPVKLKLYIAAFIAGRLATKVICISERMHRDVLRMGIQPEKIVTIYRGIPIADYLSAASNIQKPIPPAYDQPETKKIITVGRFFPEKGMRYVVEAAVDVFKKHQNTLWWLVGKEGPESEYCKQLVRDNNMEDRIFFLGQRNDVPALLAQAWLQVVGSLSEGLGQMALESSAFEVPTIGTKIGGLDEAIINGTTGILVEPGSWPALASATKYILSNPDVRHRLGRAAKDHVFSNFDSSNLIPNLLNVFEEDFAAAQ